MPLSAVDELGAYEILAPAAAGKMREVYRDRDRTLKRNVALRCCDRRIARDARTLRARLIPGENSIV
jgi:hypothetical protein